MASVTVKVEGLQELGRNLKQFSAEIQTKVLRKAVRSASNVVMKDAQARVPVGEEAPHIKPSIQVKRLSKMSKKGKEFTAVGVFKKRGNTAGDKNAQPEFYWKFVELGTVKMSARPFLVPAFTTNKAQAPEVMKKELRAGMDRAASRLAKGKKA